MDAKTEIETLREGLLEASLRHIPFDGWTDRAMAAGARGCISATANVNAAGIRNLFRQWQSPDAERLQQEVNAVRKAVERYGNIPGCKAILADRYRDPSWNNVRPPLVALGEMAIAGLLADPAIAGMQENATA